MTNWFVSTTGNNANPGTQASPKQTIAAGLGLLQIGDTLFIRGGSYAETATHSGPFGVSWAQAVTISAFESEVVTLNPSGGLIIGNIATSAYLIYQNLILDGINLNQDINNAAYCVSFNEDPHHIRFTGCEVKRSPWNGLIAGGSNQEFLNLKVHDNGDWARGAGYGPGNNGLYFYGDNSLVEGGQWYNNDRFAVRFGHSDEGQSSDNNICRKIKAYDNGLLATSGGGITMWGVGNLAHNNLIWHNNGYGIQVPGDSTNGKIYNNTIYDTIGGNGIEIQFASSTGTIIRNNIAYLGGIAEVAGASGSTIENNLQTDPSFVNAAGADFHLTSGSAAIGGGIDLSAVFTDDFDGNARGVNWDIGAYEFVTGGTMPINLAIADANASNLADTLVGIRSLRHTFGETEVSWADLIEAERTRLSRLIGVLKLR